MNEEDKKFINGDVKNMDFAEYKKYLKIKEESEPAQLRTTEKLNVWDFLINIRQHIREAVNIECQYLGNYLDNIILYRFKMNNGESYSLSFALETLCLSENRPIIILSKNTEKYSIASQIRFKELNGDNPLSMKREDVGMFVEYIHELRKNNGSVPPEC